jgi:hypothetical protein
MIKIFTSGSCRLLTTINSGYDKIEPIHSMFHNFIGVNFLGKLHNTKQHIQFIKFIKDDINLPENILNVFLTSYGKYNGSYEGIEDKQLNPIKKENIKNKFNNCDYYLFEICSLKLYEKDGYQVQHELTDDYKYILQSEEDLYNDLILLYNLVPKNKKIIFQVHFRPNIIYNNHTKIIFKREIIYNTIQKFCNQYNNCFIYDPSIILRENNLLFDGDTHFTKDGHIKSFEYIYSNWLSV